MKIIGVVLCLGVLLIGCHKKDEEIKLIEHGKNPETQFLNIQTAALKNNPEAQWWLGSIYSHGNSFGQKKDDQKAVYWLKMAAKNGSVRAQYDLACLYYELKKFKQAISYFDIAAKNGNTDSQYYLAHCYHYGNECLNLKADKKKALKWYKMAAEQGLAAAQNNLGNLLRDQKEYEEAFKWYEKGAAGGFIPAQNNLGIMYEFGLGVKKNYKEAFKWYKMAAEQGLAVAQVNLGDFYRLGKGIKRNYKEAFEFYEKAAKKNDIDALYSLGLMYEFGLGVKKNYKEAEKYYQICKKDKYEAKNALAWLWSKQGKDLGEAESLITDALKKEPENGNYIDTYGYVLYKQGKYEEALRQFQKANDLIKENAEIKSHLADTYLKLGNKEEARKYWEEALSLIKDDNKLKKEIQDKLSQLNPNHPTAK